MFYFLKKKALLAFFDVCRQARYASRLLKGSASSMGRRMFPPRLFKHDGRLGYRIDQGAYFKNGTFGVVVQQNGRPHGKALATAIVDPRVDKGEDVVERLQKDAENKGFM
jgi:hypothetical protein